MIEMGENQLNNTENLFKAIYNDSPIGIELFDSNGKLIDLNQSCMELFGVSSKDDVKGFDLLSDPNIPKKHLTKLKQRETARYESIFDFDLVKKQKLYKTTKSGKIYVDVLITPLFIKERKHLSNYLVQVQDISDRKIVEHKLIDSKEELENIVQERTKKLRRSEEDWRFLVEEAPDIIFTVNRKGTILYINKVPQGMTPEQAIGTDVLDYVDSEYHKIVKNSIEKVFQTGGSDYFEISARGPDDSDSWYSTRLGAIRQDEEVVSVMLITRDITKRKKMEQKLIESKEKYRLITENASDLIVILDENFKYEYINEQVHKKLMGYSKEDLIKKSSLEFIHPDDLEKASKALRKGFNEGEGLGIVRVRNKKGDYVWLEIKGKAFVDKDGNTKGIMISRDITDRKKAEEKLKESEEKFRTISDQSLVAITIAQNGIIKYINKQMEELSGYSLEEMNSWNAGEFLKIIHPDYKELVAEQSKKKQMGQNDVIDQYQIMGIKKSGELIWVENFSKTITYEGNPAVLSIMIDITEKKEAEQKLKDSEERYRTLIDNILDIIYEFDLEGKITYLSPQTIDMLGYNPEELINRNAFRFIHPDDKEEVLKNHNYIINSGEIGSVEFRIRHKKGRYLTVSSRGQLIEKDGERKIIGLFRDVTERKKIEEKVQEEKEKAEMYINLVNVIIVALDKDGNILMINRRGYNILGWDTGELDGKSWFENCLPSRDREKVQEYFKKLMKEEIDIIPFYENSVLSKNGDEKLIAWSTILFRDSNGQIVGALNSGDDITERKRAEEKILESEKKLMDLIESVPVGISISTPEGKLLECNSQAFQIFGYSSKEEFLSILVINLYQDPSDREKFLELLEKGLVKDFEVKFKRKDGTMFWGSLTSVTHNEGEQTLFINSFQDITDRKITEIKIQQSEAELFAIYNYTPIAILLLDRDRRIRKINKFVLKFTDRKEEEVFGIHGGEALRCLYSIKDPRGCGFSEKCKNCVIRNTVLDTFKSKSPHINVEATLYLLPDSEVDKVHLLFSTVPLDVEGEDRVLVSIIDITERIKAEQRLKESEERYRNFIENFQGIAFQGYKDFSAAFFHGNVEEITGYHEEDFISGRIKWNQIIHPDDLTIVNEKVKIYHESSAETDMREYRIINQKGELHSLIEYNQKFYDNIINKEGVRGVIIDNTKYKEAEQLLIDSEEKYRKLFNNAPFAIVLFNTEGFILDCNEASSKITGYYKDELVGKNFKEFDFYTDIQKALLEEREFAIKQGEVPTPREVFLKKKDKNQFWARSYIDFIHLGSETYMQAIIQDVTEQKNAKAKLKESEERFKYLVSSSPAIIYTSKTSGDYGATFMSDNVEEKWGYDPQLFVNNSEFWLDHVHLDDKDYVLKTLSDLIEKDHLIYEYRFKINDDTYHWMRDEVMVVRDKYGNPIETIGSVIDITERVEAEQGLKESEEKFRTIAEQSALGILIQQNGDFKFVNKALSDIIEYPLEEVNNWTEKEIIKVIHKEDLHIVKEKSQEREEGDYNKTINYECRVVTRTGRIKWLEVTSKPINYLGEFSILISLIDITPRKKVEEELKEISRLKSELLSRTSHELKTPLVSIKGYADLLLSQHYEMLDIYTVSVLNEIKQGCYRLESLIKDLLETSKLESEEIELNKLEDDLAFLIRFCIRDLRGLVEIRNHELILDIQNNMITMMEKERIYEVIMNLLSNAIKYTPPHGQISIKSEIKENNYIISIRDNGIGLNKDEQDKIFKKFGKIERYGKGMDVVSEGSGLGLYISKKIIELHGGEIWVESEGRDKGSTFYFSLPIITK